MSQLADWPIAAIFLTFAPPKVAETPIRCEAFPARFGLGWCLWPQEAALKSSGDSFGTIRDF